MAYYLTIKKKVGYKFIDISSLGEFTRISKFKNRTYSLEEIDNCTSWFKDEVEFKRVLYTNNLIDLEDISSEISIRMKYKDSYDKVKYGLVFEEQKKYININSDYLRGTILSLHNDMEFLKKLVSHYRNSYSNSITIGEIRYYIYTSGNCELSIYNLLNRFFRNEIFNLKDGSLKYKALHHLGMFVYNYVENKKRESLNISEESADRNRKLELLELQRNIILEREKKSKKIRTRKIENEDVEGQLSLFDEML